MATSPTSARLAKNVTSLRLKRNFTQGQLAKVAGIPRSTLTNIESGSANPSLQNLIKISAALQVSIEELLSSPRPAVKLISAKQMTVDKKARGQAEILRLLSDPVPGLELDRIRLQAGARMKGTPHLPRTKEYFYCIEGEVRIYVLGEGHTLKTGDMLAFPGDEPHAYENPQTRGVSSGIGIVVLNFGPDL